MNRLLKCILIFIVFNSIGYSAVEFIKTNNSYIVSDKGIDLNGSSGGGGEMTVMFWIYSPPGSLHTSEAIVAEGINTNWAFDVRSNRIYYLHGSAQVISVALATATWSHIAVVARNYVTGVHYAQTDMYLNGELTSSCNASVNCTNGFTHNDSTVIHVGIYPGPIWPADETIQDLRIFNYGIVPGQFTGLNTFVRGDDSILKSIAGSRSFNLIAHDENQVLRWIMDNGNDGQSYGKVIDSSGNNNYGTLTNSPRFVGNSLLGY